MRHDNAIHRIIGDERGDAARQIPNLVECKMRARQIGKCFCAKVCEIARQRVGEIRAGQDWHSATRALILTHRDRAAGREDDNSFHVSGFRSQIASFRFAETCDLRPVTSLQLTN